jgi:O-acetylserine/cysteine efflux transporter
MSPAHFLLALATVVIWGCNYVVIAWGLRDLPPVLLAVARFGLAAFPLVLFLPRPKLPWRTLAGYALFMFALQFGFLFAGIKAGLPAGLASLVIQLQVFATMGLAMLFLGDRPRPAQWAGATVALAGIALVALHLPSRASLLGFALVVGSALAWGMGNILTKRQGQADPLALVAWSSLLAVPLLLAAALGLEGPAALGHALARSSWTTLGLVLYQAYPTTLFGFAAWSYLLRRYPTSTVAPFSLLVPMCGMTAGWLFLGEPMAWWKLTAAGLVLGGLGLNQSGPGPALDV